MSVLQFWKQFLMFGLCLYEGEPGSGGGGGGDATFTQEQLNAAVTAAVEKEKQGLIAKNQELLGKMQGMKEQLDKFDGIDLDAINKMQKKFADDNEKQLFEQHGFEGVVQARLADANTQHEAAMSKAAKDMEKVTSERDMYRNKYNTGIVEGELRKAAIAAGVLPSAVEDVLLRGNRVFTVGENDKVEARDAEGNLRTIGTGGDLLTTANFIEGLKEEAPHYWPASEGAKAKGQQRTSPTADIDARMQAAADAGDMELYRKLRKERAAARA